MAAPIDSSASRISQPVAAAGGSSNDRQGVDLDLLRRRVYEFSDLSTYRQLDRLIIRTADLFLYWLIRAICSTLRWEMRGRQHLDSIIDRGHRPIFAFWHTCILGATWFTARPGLHRKAGGCDACATHRTGNTSISHRGAQIRRASELGPFADSSAVHPCGSFHFRANLRVATRKQRRGGGQATSVAVCARRSA